MNGSADRSSTASGETLSVGLIAGAGLPMHEAERLLGAATGAPRATLVGGLPIDRAASARFARMVRRRRAGEPLQYLEGTAQFGPIEVKVDRRVLIPRPETEQLWERVMKLVLPAPCVVVDMGTGSGCLGLAIKHERADVRVIATDVSRAALEAARANAARLGLDVEFIEGDRLAALDPSLRGAVALIVTNPPYVSESEWPHLPGEVRDHEPRVALVMGDGLDMYRYLAGEAGAWLVTGGVLVAEIGASQGHEVRRLFGEAGWTAEIGRDWAGRDRFLVARTER